MINLLTAEFVKNVPHDTIDGVLYISVRYSLAIHRCCCGCGKEVTTKLSPSRWSLIFDGDTASLTPSIGNWDFPCKSHYWIWRNEIRWAREFTEDEIQSVRKDDIAADLQYLGPQPDKSELTEPVTDARTSVVAGWISRIFRSRR